MRVVKLVETPAHIESFTGVRVQHVMNWEIIGATGDWAGAFMVVITLFYYPVAKKWFLSRRELTQPTVNLLRLNVK